MARNKTDELDAKMIACFCRLYKPTKWQPKPEEVQTLDALVKRLDVLNKMYLEEQNRMEMVETVVTPSIQNMLTLLKKAIKDIDTQIQQHIEHYPVLQQNHQLLQTIPGVGKKTSFTLLAILGDIETFDNAKQLAAYAGLNPCRHQSGSSINRKAHISKTGRSDLRKMLYMPAIVAIRKNPVICAFYKRLLDNGKAKRVALCAAMRKLLHIIYGVLKSGKSFNPEVGIVP